MGLSHTTLLIEGLALGLSAGLAPGPLTVLVVSRSARFGVREGMKASIAPLITDAPVILTSLLLVRKAANLPVFLTILTLMGSLVLFRLGYESLTVTPPPDQDRPSPGKAPGTLRAALAVNLLNPHPWLFWFTVGAPLVSVALESNRTGAVLFLSAFYTMLVGSKLVLTLASARLRHVLGSVFFLWTNRVLGAVLILMAVQFLMSALSSLSATLAP